MIDRLKKLSSAHIWLLSMVVSIIMTECIVGGMGWLLKWEATYDYLLKGLVASLFVAGLGGGFLIFFLARQRRIEAGHRIDASASEAREDAATEEVAAACATAQEDTATVSHYVAAAHHIIERKPVEAQISNDKKQADLRLAIKNLEVLPAMPVIAQKLLALNLNTEEGQRMLLVLIEQDPQISAKIIGLANSALFGVSRHVSTVRHAALLLGIKRVQSIATGIAIISLMTKTPAGEFKVQDLWLHSFRIAFAMQGIARFMPDQMRPSNDQIFLAGMLHDIGYLVLAYLDQGSAISCITIWRRNSSAR